LEPKGPGAFCPLLADSLVGEVVRTAAAIRELGSKPIAVDLDALVREDRDR